MSVNASLKKKNKEINDVLSKIAWIFGKQQNLLVELTGWFCNSASF